MDSIANNADLAELDKFAKLADLWWNENGPMGMLHVINPLRLNFITQRVELKGKKVIDIGCGGGILTEAMAKAGAIVSGIDLSAPTLNVAKLHAAESDLAIDYNLQDIENLAQKHPGEYDVIACMEMLEHVPDPARVVAACVKLLKPNGHVFFSTINRTLKAFLFAIIGAEYVLRILPKGTHSYRSLIKPAELEQWANATGLELKQLSSFIYNPFKKSFKLKDKVDINYITHYQAG